MSEKILNIKGILNDSFKAIYDSAIYLLLFELIYKGLILVFFKPVLNIIVSMFIRAGGYKLLVNQDIAEFLFSFTGVFMVLVVMTISVILVYYEFTVILLVLDKSKKGEKIELLKITEKALLKLKNVIRKQNIGLALYILVLIPLLNIGIQSSLIPTLSIPNFIIGELQKYPGSGVLLIGVILLLIYLFSKLFIVLPSMVFGGKTFKEGARDSFKTIKGEGFKITTLIIVSMLIWIILTYLPFILLENVEFILLRILRALSNISMAIFTLLISPFILSISLGSYDTYSEVGLLERKKEVENIELGYISRKIWSVLEKIFEYIQGLIIKSRKYLKTVIAIVLILLISFNIYSEESLDPIYPRQLLIGHRGGEYGVENTVEAITFAGKNGADYAEMDVLLTKDDVPVVIHDNSLKRLAEMPKNISDMTLSEVRDVTIKSDGIKDNIPSLRELAIEVKDETKLLLEFKTHGKETASIVDKTVEILEDEGILDETIFHTSQRDIIEEFNEKHEKLPIGYVFIGTLGTFSAKRMSNMPVDFISAEETLIDKRLIREIHKAGKAIFAWTINDDYKAERLLQLGIDGIITDYPVEMLELRNRYIDWDER